MFEDSPLWPALVLHLQVNFHISHFLHFKKLHSKEMLPFYQQHFANEVVMMSMLGFQHPGIHVHTLKVTHTHSHTHLQTYG